MMRILKYIALDILKNRIIIAYTILLAVFSWTVFSLEDNSTKGLLSLLNIVLITIPLMSVLFSTIYIYNSNEFIELLVSHPIKRSTIWKSLFTGLSISLVLSYIIGVGVPLLIFANWSLALIIIITGCFLSTIFTSIAFLSYMLTRDKTKGIGISILLWIYFTLLFDGLVLFLFFQFADYPIEKVVIMLSALSPVDLSRILILLQLDVSAMFGYTGAIFKSLFGNSWGMLLSFMLLTLWVLCPFYFSLRRFKKKDL